MQDNSIGISVIVPVYNVQEYLTRCVDSLLAQTCQKLEILLIDDGSTDDSGRMCDAYQARDSRIQVLHKENGGLMSAWMAGVQISTREYLTFVDSDDWIDPEMIAEMGKKLTGQPGEMVCCNYVIDGFGTPVPKYHGLQPGVYEGQQLEQQVKPQLLGHENRKISFSRCMKLISRELIEQNMHFCNPALKMGEDVNIILPALLDCKRLVVMQDAVYYHYFYHQASIVHKYDTGLYDNIKLLDRTIREIAAEKKLLEERSCDREYIFLLMLVLKNEARGNQKTGARNIRTLCKTENTPDLLRRNPVQITEKANQLLVFVMKHPCGLTISLLRLAMKWYYRGKM